jgi:hypothetical protein
MIDGNALSIEDRFGSFDLSGMDTENEEICYLLRRTHAY